VTEDSRGKLELILDVPIRSRVVLGATKRKLKDLLGVKPGMIIETDSNVADYVKLYVNDNVIALGEVVVVGESYGLNVKQIVSPLERIQKLQ
jgi:flagellar motor switch protein FliN/FliY